MASARTRTLLGLTTALAAAHLLGCSTSTGPATPEDPVLVIASSAPVAACLPSGEAGLIELDLERSRVVMPSAEGQPARLELSGRAVCVPDYYAIVNTIAVLPMDGTCPATTHRFRTTPVDGLDEVMVDAELDVPAGGGVRVVAFVTYGGVPQTLECDTACLPSAGRQVWGVSNVLEVVLE